VNNGRYVKILNLVESKAFSKLVEIPKGSYEL